MAIRNNIRIVVMVAVLILSPILLSILASQYEACKFIKKDCIKLIPQNHTGRAVPPGQFLEEVVCDDTKPGATKPVYKDTNTGKCYGFSEEGGSSPPPPNANLVWIGRDKDKNTNPSYP